jgi:hypothetical protein
MSQGLSKTRIWLLLVFLSLGIFVSLALIYRASIKSAIATVGLRIAAPFVSDLTAPSFAARNHEIEVLRSETANLKQDMQRLEELKIAQAQALDTIEVLRAELASQKRATESIRESHLSLELLKREYLTPLRRRLSALDGLDPSSRGANVLDLDRQEDAPPNLVPVVAMLDETSLYSKGDRIEMYGVNLKQTRSGPLLIKESILNVEDRRAVVLWWPRYSNLSQATHARIRLSEANRAEHGAIALVVKLRDQETFKFEAKLGDSEPSAPTQSSLGQLPPDIATMLDGTAGQQLMIRAGNDFLVELPPELRARIAKLGADAIDVVALQLENAAGTDVSLSEVSFVRPQFALHKSVTLFGSLSGPPQPAGSVVKLLGIDGAVRTSPISTSNSFVFKDVQKGQPASIRFNVNGQDYFADQGRWIVPKDDMTVAVHVEPLYVNSDNHKPDPAEREFHFYDSLDNPGASLYLPHSRQRWNGIGPIQQFDSITFTNNWGYVDRDRFAANPENCYRIVHLGSSHTVALQVPIAQKYNFLLEEELGLKLKRCVEVLSAGRDNGDPGANYPSIRNYALRFNPDMVMLEIQAGLLMQLEPSLLKQKLGWDPKNSAIGRVVPGPDGRMIFQPPNSNYLLYAENPDHRQLVPGVSFEDTIKIEWNKLPDVARKAYSSLVDIVNFYRKEFPGVRFVLQTGADQAQCTFFPSCADSVVTAADGTTFRAGLNSFLANFKSVCRDAALECIDLPHDGPEIDPRLPLIIAIDGHYNIRGHQWLARELAAQIYGDIASTKR